MKTTGVLAGALILASSTSNRANAISPAQAISEPIAKGFFIGAVSTGIKNAISNIEDAAKTPEDKNNATSSSKEKSEEKEATPIKSFVRNVGKTSAKCFVGNSVATTYLDKLIKTPHKQRVHNIASLPLPIATMAVTKESIKDINLPDKAKDAIGYAAFWGGRLAQGRDPLTAALTVGGFAAGATVVKSIANRKPDNTEKQQDPDEIKIDGNIINGAGLLGLYLNKPAIKSNNEQKSDSLSKQDRKTYSQMVTGYMPSNQNKMRDNAKDTAEDMLKKKLGIPKETQLWPQGYSKFSGSYTSYLVPISDEEYKDIMSR